MVMRSQFEQVVAGVAASIQADPEGASARKLLTLELARMGSRLFSPEERVAWCGVLAPFDALSAMGVTSCYVEFVGGWLASVGAVEPMLEAADQSGFATDCCGYHRAVIGAALQGIMPEPDFLVATSTPCSAGMASIENLARHFGKDMFTIHIPHRDDREGVAYLADQFRAMMDFAADHTGERLDLDRLRTAMENTNRARALMVETYELAQSVPSPARMRDLSNFGIIIVLLLGKEGAVTVAQAYRDEFARKVDEGVEGVPGERVRLMWIQNRIQFRNPVEQMLEEEFAAAIVFDELNQIDWDPIDLDDPYTGLAKRALSVCLTGPMERRIDTLQRQARAYQVDGALNPCHWGCRQGTGVRGLIEQGLREIDLPVLNLEVDCVDPRNFSEGQIRTRLTAFIEMLTARKERLASADEGAA